MLFQKKEQYRQQIRKQILEDILMEKRQRNIEKNNFQEYQDQMENEINILCSQIEAECNFSISKFPLLQTILKGELTSSIILLLQLIVKKCKEAKKIDNLEILFEDYNLGKRILEKCEKEQNLQQVDEQLYLLGNLSQYSFVCQARLIQLQIFQNLKKIVNLDIESNENLISSFTYLITTFVEPNSRIPFEDVKQLMQILDQLCKKLRGINFLYIEFDFETQEKYTEFKYTLLRRILLFVRYFIDKSQFQVNLTIYQNFWVILTNLAFLIQKQYTLRLDALQTIQESIKLNNHQLKFDILEKNPDIFFQLLILMDHHQLRNSATDKRIRIQALIIMKQLFQDQSQYIIQNIHLNQIPQQLLQLVQRETDYQVLFHQLEALFLIVSNSSYEQCIDLYNNGLLTLLINIFQKMKDSQEFILSKYLIKLIFVVLQHNSYDNCIMNFLKQHKIIQYLNDIVINSKHENICQIANQLLKQIY